jgi:ribose transport system permease protein
MFLAGRCGRNGCTSGGMVSVASSNGLSLMQVGAYAQSIAIGSILIFAMAVARH